MLAMFYNLLMKQNVSACVCVSFKNICKIASSRRQGWENRNFPSSVNIVILCIHRRQHFCDSTLKCFWNCKRSKLLLKAFYVSGIVLGSEKITIFKNPWTWPEDLFDWWRASKQYYIDRVKTGHHQAMIRVQRRGRPALCAGAAMALGRGVQAGRLCEGWWGQQDSAGGDLPVLCNVLNVCSIIRQKGMIGERDWKVRGTQVSVLQTGGSLEPGRRGGGRLRNDGPPRLNSLVLARRLTTACASYSSLSCIFIIILIVTDLVGQARKRGILFFKWPWHKSPAFSTRTPLQVSEEERGKGLEDTNWLYSRKTTKHTKMCK